MKKTVQTLLSVLLGVLMIFSVFACGEPENPSLTVTLSQTTLTLTVGDTQRLTPGVAGGEADTMRWTTSNAEVATVSGGTVTAVGAGTATISFTATLGEKDFTATCQVTVNAPQPQNVTVSFQAKGTEAGTLTVLEGTVLDATQFPELPDVDGYDKVEWDYDGEAITQYTVINGIYTARTDTAYKIEYYAENIFGERVLIDTVNKQGTTDETYVLLDEEKELTDTAETEIVDTLDMSVSDFVLDEDATVSSGKIVGAGTTVLKVVYKTSVQYNRGMAQPEQGQFTITSNDLFEDCAYQFFTEKSDTVVFSVDITLPVADMGSNLDRRVGIIFSNGEKLGMSGASETYKFYGQFQSSQIYLFANGLCTFNNYTYMGRDAWSPGLEGYLATDDIDTRLYGLDSDTHNLTVILLNDYVYAYVDGEFIYRWEITSSLLSGTVDGLSSMYAKGDEYMFGIVCKDMQQFRPVFKNIERFYGDDAMEEIETNYASLIEAPAQVGIEEIETGVYQNIEGSTPTGTTMAYKYFTENKSDTAIFSVTFDAPLKGDGTRDHFVKTGITFTDGRQNADFSYMGGQVLLFGGDNTLMSGANNRITRTNAYGDAYHHLTVANPFASKNTAKLTVVYYNSKIYAYVDDAYVTNWSITDQNFCGFENSSSTAFSASAELMFGIATIGSHSQIITFTNVTALYDDDALAELQSNPIYVDTQKDLVKNIFKKQALNEYKIQGANPAYYYFTDKKSDSVLFSVDITLAGSKNTQFGDRPGITISNGVDATTQSIGSWQGGQICLFVDNNANFYSFKTLSNGGAGRDKNSPGLAKYGLSANPYDDNNKANLTIAIYNGNIYAYVNGEFICSWAVTDANLCGSNGSTAFAATDQFYVGLVSPDPMSYGASFKVVNRLYGEAAETEIESNPVYVNTQKTLSNGIFKKVDANEYSISGSAPVYHYFTDKKSDTVVFSVDLIQVASNTSYSDQLGITISNGVDATTPTVGTWQGGQITITNYLSLMTHSNGEQYGVNYDTHKDYTLSSNPWVAGNGTANLTIAIYNGKIYAYVAGTYVTSWDVTSEDICGRNGSTAFETTDQFYVGLAVKNAMSYGGSFKVVKRLYGADAVNEINSNDLYESIRVTE